MRIETHQDGTTTAYVRQSWLNDFLTCPERARRAYIDERDDLKQNLTTPEAALGTGVHAYAEYRLLGESKRIALSKAEFEYHEDLAVGFREPKLSMEKGQEWLSILCAAWEANFLDKVNPIALEHEFEQSLGTIDGLQVILKGTIDAVDLGGFLWDWKTAGDRRKYQADGWKLRRWAVQPTVYAMAAWQEFAHLQWPLEFRYGALVRDSGMQVVVQTLAVERTKEHGDWLLSQVASVANMVSKLGWDSPWPLNDQHALCSEAWCPWFKECKGRFVSL